MGTKVFLKYSETAKLHQFINENIGNFKGKTHQYVAEKAALVLDMPITQAHVYRLNKELNLGLGVFTKGKKKADLETLRAEFEEYKKETEKAIVAMGADFTALCLYTKTPVPARLQGIIRKSETLAKSE